MQKGLIKCFSERVGRVVDVNNIDKVSCVCRLLNLAG